MSQSKTSSLIILFDKSLNITAPIPTFLAISSFPSIFGFFSSIIAFALVTASFKISSNFIKVPSLVDIFPVFSLTIPYGTWIKPFVYFSSKSRNLATSNTCLKCKFCSYATTYIHLSKSYVLALYKIAAKSRVAYVVEPFDLVTINGGMFLYSKSTISAPCDSSNLLFFLKISTTSCILSE